MIRDTTIDGCIHTQQTVNHGKGGLGGYVRVQGGGNSVKDVKGSQVSVGVTYTF